MMSQTYNALNAAPSAGGVVVTLIYSCSGCGAVVHNMARHDQWHESVSTVCTCKLPFGVHPDFHATTCPKRPKPQGA
jgi:hypothetical protein